MRMLHLSAVLLVVMLAGCTVREEVVVLRLAHVLATDHPVHLGMARFGERLEALSGGTMRVEIYPNGQLGSERETIELLQLGTLDLAKVSAAVVENFVPEMGVFSLPYLFDDADHLWRVLNGPIGKEILLAGEPYRIRGLCYYDAGFRSFYVRDRAVQAPEDLQGLKIRVMRSNLSIRTINLLGGNATPLAYGEIYTALQQGVVDGAENNPPNFYGSKHYEVSRYYILDEHSAPPDVLLISTWRWNQLSAQQRAWIEEAIEESVAYQRELWEEATAAALAAVEEAGITVIQPDKTPFRQAVAPLYEDLKGTELGRWAERIRALATAPAGKAAARDTLSTNGSDS
ncbi:TRAP transporter substrate-binding protein [Rhodocaloribacter litoris]|uniref:TRAP transporter substrate-binding protein n=1 Tax=Rhodocaloribacter litoris TaxID=2558931 RepID=UPI001E508C77|nr:TRAP transporter substrate-binding protein [Rhodocaloribacter litoris]QXD14099.1 TRAP transporter substrate-binding protein [Rhodocaloribacter litoris]